MPMPETRTGHKIVIFLCSRLVVMYLLTLIRMTKDEKGLAFFKGLLL
jgi:hypothetical protein